MWFMGTDNDRKEQAKLQRQISRSDPNRLSYSSNNQFDVDNILSHLNHATYADDMELTSNANTYAAGVSTEVSNNSDQLTQSSSTNQGLERRRSSSATFSPGIVSTLLSKKQGNMFADSGATEYPLTQAAVAALEQTNQQQQSSLSNNQSESTSGAFHYLFRRPVEVPKDDMWRLVLTEKPF